MNKSPYFLFLIYYLIYSQHKKSPVKIFSAPKRKKCKIKRVIVSSKWRDMKINVSPLLTKLNNIFQFFIFVNINVLE